MAVDRFPVEASHIMMFARAIGDENPIHHDAAYARKTALGSIIAPPTFVQASAQFDPDYLLRPKIGQPWFGSGRAPSGIQPASPGAIGRGLHAEQHFEYHRHLMPGDLLSATVRPGLTWEKQSRRAGRLVFAETVTEYRDQRAELVITARSVGVQSERAVEPTPGAKPAATAPGARDAGEACTECLVDNLTRTQIVQYAGASGDYNPLHTDEVFATQVAGYPSVFAHGMLTMGMTGRMVARQVGDGRLTKFGVRFTGLVWPGDTLHATATAEPVAGGAVRLRLETTNQHGLTVLSGYAEARAA